MGEYATYRGYTIKIGTTEDMQYLRPDQIDLVSSPTLTDITDLLFRFPFPDEDDREPGDFADHDRGLPVRGYQVPAGIRHHAVQFTAAAGIRVSLPCPYSDAAQSGDLPYTFHGIAGPSRIVRQRVWAGVWATVLACGPCHALFRLPDLDAARPLLDAIDVEIDNATTHGDTDRAGLWAGRGRPGRSRLSHPGRPRTRLTFPAPSHPVRSSPPGLPDAALTVLAVQPIERGHSSCPGPTPSPPIGTPS